MKTIEQVIDHYIGHTGGTPRKKLDAVLMEIPGRTPMAEVLFRMHKHAGAVAKLNPNMIVYMEEDIVDLLNFLGYEVKFGDE